MKEKTEINKIKNEREDIIMYVSEFKKGHK